MAFVTFGALGDLFLCDSKSAGNFINLQISGSLLDIRRLITVFGHN